MRNLRQLWRIRQHKGKKGGGGGSANPDEQIVGSIPASGASSLLVGSVSVLDVIGCNRSHGLPFLCMAGPKIVGSQSGIRPRDSLVVDDDVQKSTNQTKQTITDKNKPIYANFSKVVAVLDRQTQLTAQTKLFARK